MKKVRRSYIEIIIGLVGGFVLMAFFDFLENKFPDTVFGEHRTVLFGATIIVIAIVLVIYERSKPRNDNDRPAGS